MSEFRNILQKTKHWDFVRGVLAMIVVLFMLYALILAIVSAFESDAHALSNPLTNGKNVSPIATVVAARVPATGQNCAVTILNFDSTPLITGYQNRLGDGGVGLTYANSVRICSNSSACVNTWFVRDAVPDSIYYKLASVPADGGITIGIEMGAGCVSP